jgi:hypothetical protein
VSVSRQVPAERALEVMGEYLAPLEALVDAEMSGARCRPREALKPWLCSNPRRNVGEPGDHPRNKLVAQDGSP